MKEKTFYRRGKDGELIGDPVPYTPIVVISLNAAYTLALHKTSSGWAVSDPVSGGKILNVSATYKGCPVSSEGLTKSQARANARDDLDLLIERVGSEKFNRILDFARL